MPTAQIVKLFQIIAGRYIMLNSDLKQLIKAYDEVKDFDFIKSCETYNEYLWWGKTILDIKEIKEVK